LTSFRLDLPGLGDSILQDAACENDSYPPYSSDVIASAIDTLGRQHGATAFVVMGLCSGAHTSFHAALDLADRRIIEAVLINPLTFYYTPGMPLDVPGSQSAGRWQPHVDAIREMGRRSTLVRAAADAVKTVLYAGRRLRRKHLTRRPKSGLSRDLARLAREGRKITFVFSRFDPGYDLLMTDASRTVKQSVRSGHISLLSIKHANHTFDATGPRAQMIHSLEAYLVGRYLWKPSAAMTTTSRLPSSNVGPDPVADAGAARAIADPVRLLTFVTDFGCGGTERQFVNLGRALDAKRFALEYGCMRLWGQLLKDVSDREIPIREYPIRRLWGAAAMVQQLRLARYLRRRRIQILHSYNFYSNVFAIPAAWLAGVPVIIASIRDRGVYLTNAQRHVQRYVCRLADCVLVNAESIKEWLVNDGYDASKILVIRNGIDLPRFEAPRAAGIRRQLGIPDEAPIVAMVARLNAKKGVEDFIDAAAIVSRNHPDVRFLIVGQGHVSDHGAISEDTAYRQALDDRATGLALQDRMHLIGYRSDVPALLSETAVSVLPSHSEGLSNALLESMAAGVPVVATRVGGTPEAIEHGVTGLLVPACDPRALAESIGRVLTDGDLAARLGAAGRHAVRDRFGMDRMVHATEQLYLDLLVRRSAEAGRHGQRQKLEGRRPYTSTSL
jgi:glycosyltransferase involved in cell wall biosynthesis